MNVGQAITAACQADKQRDLWLQVLKKTDPAVWERLQRKPSPR